MIPATVAIVPRINVRVSFSFSVTRAMILDRKGVMADRLVALEAPINVRLTKKK